MSKGDIWEGWKGTGIDPQKNDFWAEPEKPMKFTRPPKYKISKGTDRWNTVEENSNRDGGFSGGLNPPEE